MILDDSLPCLYKPATDPYPEPDESDPQLSNPIYLRYILTVPHICLGLPSGLFPFSFPTKILYGFHISFMRATCTVNPILLDFITSLYSPLHVPTASSPCSQISPVRVIFP